MLQTNTRTTGPRTPKPAKSCSMQSSVLAISTATIGSVRVSSAISQPGLNERAEPGKTKPSDRCYSLELSSEKLQACKS